NTLARRFIRVTAPEPSASGRHCVALKLTSSTWRMASPPSASYPTTTVIDETSSGTATDVERCVYTHSATPGNVSICSPPSKRTPRRTVSTTSEVRTQADRSSVDPGSTLTVCVRTWVPSGSDVRTHAFRSPVCECEPLPSIPCAAPPSNDHAPPRPPL